MRKSLYRFLIYQLGNLTHFLHASSIDDKYDRLVTPSAAGVTVPDTSLSMIVVRTNPFATPNMRAIDICYSDDNLCLKFPLNFISSMNLSDENCF